MLPHYSTHPSLNIGELRSTLWNYQSPKVGYGNKNIIKSFGETAMIAIRELFPDDPILLVGIGGSGTMYSIGTYLSTDDPNVFHMILDDKPRWHPDYPSDMKIVMVDDDICAGRTTKKVISRLEKANKVLSAIVVIANNTKNHCGRSQKLTDWNGIPIIAMV